MKKVNKELTALPKSFAEQPQSHLLRLCSEFTKDVDDYASGKPNDDPTQSTFLRGALPHYRMLMDKIISTRPKFDVCRANVTHCAVAQVPLGVIVPCPVVPAVGYSPPVALDHKTTNQGNTARVSRVPSKSSGAPLEYVRKIIQDMSSRELAGITPFRVHEHFISLFIRKWEEVCLDAFSEVEKLLKAEMDALYEKHFGRFKSSGLMYDIRSVRSSILH